MKMEDDVNSNVKGRRHQIFDYWEMEDDLNFIKSKTNSIFLLMKDVLNVPFKLKTTPVSYQVMLAQPTLASPELGSAQPQLVQYYSYLTLFLL